MKRTSLSRRIPLLMAGVAAIAVLLGAIVAWPLLRAAADSTAQRTLSRTADLTADLTAELLQRAAAGEFPGPRSRVSAQLAALLAPQQVTLHICEPSSCIEVGVRAVPSSQVERPLRPSDVQVVTSGGDGVRPPRRAVGGELRGGASGHRRGSACCWCSRPRWPVT